MVASFVCSPLAQERRNQHCSPHLSRQFSHIVIRKVIWRKTWQTGIPTLHHAASSCGVNSGALQLALKKHATSYYKLVDEQKKKRALEALSDRDTIIADIVQQPGYPDAVNFNRAFRRRPGRLLTIYHDRQHAERAPP